MGLDKKGGRVERILKEAGLTGTVCSGDFVPTCSFDAMFNIFHHNVISHLLPYLTKYDKESWWYSSSSKLAYSMDMLHYTVKYMVRTHAIGGIQGDVEIKPLLTIF